MRARDLRIQLETVGLRGMARLALQHRTRARSRAYEICRPLAEGRRGIEVGGPSPMFTREGALPLYPLFALLDNCDFTHDTIWHAEAREGAQFRYDPDHAPGRTFIRDGTQLEGIEDASYDVLLSSHTLEHIADPVRALIEWKRVVGIGGHLVLILPHLENTFDHRRPVTTLEHLEADFARATGEGDMTHVEEFVELCDLRRVPDRLSRTAFEQRTRAFVLNRTVHHHVFDTELVVRLLDLVGCQLLWVETALPFHIIAVARATLGTADNRRFLRADADWRRRSVFRRDRSAAAAAPA